MAINLKLWRYRLHFVEKRVNRNIHGRYIIGIKEALRAEIGISLERYPMGELAGIRCIIGREYTDKP
jgi:hypothetical protein